MSIHEQIKEILINHKGKENAIIAPKIAEKVGIEPGASGVTIRKKILETIKMFSIPIAGISTGYYFIENKQELETYIKSLYSRVSEIIDRVRLITSLYYRYYESEELELTGEIIDDDIFGKGEDL